jgi:hypothetical protein
VIDYQRSKNIAKSRNICVRVAGIQFSRSPTILLAADSFRFFGARLNGNGNRAP